MTEQQKVSRKEQILQCLASMLENPKAERITTASLAKAVGVSEAALYRHFPSKARMFEGLIEFVEETVFSRVNMIARGDDSALNQCHQILSLLIIFAERNPGISRILNGSALTGEHERLNERVSQIFVRVDSQLKQILREAEVKEGLKLSVFVPVAANMLLAMAEGRIQQFVRSNYAIKPSENWEHQWGALTKGLVAG